MSRFGKEIHRGWCFASRLGVALALFLALWPATVYAEPNSVANNSTENSSTENDSSEWQFLIEPYAWLPDVRVTTATGETITIGAGDLVENLDMVWMAQFGARKDRWTFYLDTMYMDVSERTTSTANLVGRPEEVSVKLEVEALLLTLGSSYAVLDTENTRLELLAGVNYYHEELTFDFDIGRLGETASVTDDIWNGIVGVRGTRDLAENWYVYYYADAGTGEVDYQYQFAGTLNYRFENLTLAAGYRHFYWEFDSGDSGLGSLADSQRAQGVFVGFKFFF